MCNPQLSGHGGGHDVNLRGMALEGVRLTGRFQAADGTTARFAADLADNLRLADAFFGQRLQPRFERFIELSGETFPRQEVEAVDFTPPEVTELDLAAEGVSTVLWTSGYRPAFDWIELPVIDELGLPRAPGGVTDVDGLTFIGQPWMVDMGSANLIGLVRDAEALAARW
jgi:putative flavoprotein involved in K+ transport